MLRNCCKSKEVRTADVVVDRVTKSEKRSVLTFCYLFLGAENGVCLEIEKGDCLSGDCKRDACAEAIFQSLINADCKDVAFSIISNEEKVLNDEQWTSAFQNL